MADSRPLLLLDVEGVLFPTGPTTPAGFTEVRHGRFDVRYSRRHSVWLRELASSYELTWATTWEHWANEVFSPLLRIPPLEVITFRGHTGPTVPATRKLPDVIDAVGDRAVAWIDDNLFADAEAWASGRGAPTLLVRTDPAVGMTEHDVDRLREFVADE
ncbi:MAG: HAD domain-containing protein [Acidimicrobiales bacterium]